MHMCLQEQVRSAHYPIELIKMYLGLGVVQLLAALKRKVLDNGALTTKTLLNPVGQCHALYIRAGRETSWSLFSLSKYKPSHTLDREQTD